MWWKTLAVGLILYSIVAGLTVPLKSGIQRAEPAYSKTGTDVTVRFYGYNTFFARPSAQPLRAWLVYDANYAIAASAITPLNDTILDASFSFPDSLPGEKKLALLNAIIDHPEAGASILPSAVEIRRDSVRNAAAAPFSAWTTRPVERLNVQKGFSFPYQNVVYESIRNTYYHVPMWFVLMTLCLMSAWYSVQFLRKPSLENDRKAVAFTEAGILFGLLGLFTGMVWANYTWGKPWSNDIKQLTTAVALLIYLAYFVLRSSFDEPEKGARLAAVYNIFAFATLIPLLYVVPRMFASLHPGAEGNPAFGTQDLDNTMRAVFYPAVIGWILLGFWIAQLRARYLRLHDTASGIE